MNSLLWAKLHGASTHFPIALTVFGYAFDVVSYLWRTRTFSTATRTVGLTATVTAAVFTIPSIVSGLVMTRGEMLGHGALRWHHVFAWPAFALMMGLGMWRFLGRKNSSPRATVLYLGLAAVSTGLLLAAGYWGGEMVLKS